MKIFLLISIFCFSEKMYSQSYRVTYRANYKDYVANDILVFNDSLGFYFRILPDEKDPFKKTGVYGNIIMQHGFMFNKITGEGFDGVTFQIPVPVLVKDTLRFKNWDLSSEKTEIIKGYKCRCARYYHKNKLWIEAWYTSEFPEGFGPSNCFGLPGLVLRADYKQWNYVSKAIEIERGDFQIIFPPSAKIISREEFDKQNN